MTSRDFCYWLQGVFEVGNLTALDAKQTDLVRRHLAMVFLHEIDPSMGPPDHQAKLNAMHSGKTSASTASATDAKSTVVHVHHHDEKPVFRC